MDAVALSTVPIEAASAASGSAQPGAIDPAEARHFADVMAEGRFSTGSSSAASSSQPLQSVYTAFEQFLGGTSAPSGEMLASRIAPPGSLRDTESAIVEFGRQQQEIVQFSTQSMAYFSKMHICTALASACSNQFNALLKSNG
jgi:hypothetical protein